MKYTIFNKCVCSLALNYAISFFLAAVIKGNHTNCAQFAQANRLDWLFSRLGSQQAAEGTGKSLFRITSLTPMV